VVFVSKTLISTLSSFLRIHICLHDKILLGLSGGADSLALFYLLFECQKNYPFTLHVVYVDHGWREEAKKESELLREICEKKKVFFHPASLEMNLTSNNLEELARKGRFHVFQEIYTQIGASALFLAHQKEDFAETLLKRLFEGTDFLHLEGMKEVSRFENMRLLRPLLGICKEELREFLRDKLV
jgi:tRNA(Ile)-lysidine synthase